MRILVMIGTVLMGANAMAADEPKNVYGEPLKQHSAELSTGFYRDGYCNTGAADTGSHTVAAVVTDAFLTYTKSRGNDLQTPRPEYKFPGLKAGDRWCLCAARWNEAEKAGVAPPVDLYATHKKALSTVSLEKLKKYQLK